MSLNKLALLRYKTIDACLQNRYRKWTLEDLIDKVSDALYEYEGIKSGISKRTIQLDIQNMRSDKLGYNAPIIVIDKKYYTYEEKDFTITKSKLSVHDLELLEDAIKILGQFKGFSQFEDITSIIGKLQNKVTTSSKNSQQLIHFEKNDLLIGLHWIDIILDALKKKIVLEISYQSYKATNPTTINYHPFLLKEYRNRWFLLCTNEKKQIQLLALDRIKNITFNKTIKYIGPSFDPYTFFDNCIGVTKSPHQKEINVVLSLDKYSAPYILTKPLHTSQKVLKQTDQETLISIDVIMNFELEREILGFGSSVKVLSPRILQKRIHIIFQNGVSLY